MVLGVLRRQILAVLSNEPDGRPAWVAELADGDDAGFFSPVGAAWAVHQDIATLVAGPRALMMQALHPGAMAGVHDHSRYREDPFGRLDGTIRWITTVTYGTTEQARAASGWVRRIHERVRGTYPGVDGQPIPYAAGDPDLLSWVHLVFTDSFLRTHQRFGSALMPGGADAYVREWAIAGDLMGVPDPPRTVGELEAQLGAFHDSGVLRADARVADALHFVRHPPFPVALRPTYGLLFAGAVATLPGSARRMLGFRHPSAATLAGTAAVLASTKALLGRAQAVQAAERRLIRLDRAELDGAAQVSAAS